MSGTPMRRSICDGIAMGHFGMKSLCIARIDYDQIETIVGRIRVRVDRNRELRQNCAGKYNAGSD